MILSTITIIITIIIITIIITIIISIITIINIVSIILLQGSLEVNAFFLEAMEPRAPWALKRQEVRVPIELSVPREPNTP